jgi:aryl sulfotransferase
MPTLLRAPTRETRTLLMDSHRWDNFRPRADDIVIATYPKCGTTWTQRIVDLLVFQSPEPRQFFASAPWLDATFFATIEEDLATLEAQSHRRFIKTHLPFDSVPVYEGAKFIHVARDGRDACLSMHNHMRAMLPAFSERMATLAIEDGRLPPPAEGEPPQGPPETPADPHDYYLRWMDQAEAGIAGGGDLSYFEFENTYWRHRADPNVLFVHYADMKADLATEMRRISDFLEIDTPDDLLPKLAAAATFETMKAQGEALMPQLANAFEGGSQRFLNKGTNGRWRDILTPADLERYDALVARTFSPTLAHYLTHGRRAAGDPKVLPD